MSIRANEDKLFAEWAEKLVRDGVINETCEFIKDGVVDEIQYGQAEYKVLFVLKEVNGGKDWDLREFLANGGRPETWNNISCWTEGIVNIEKEYMWKDLEKQDRERRIKYLQKICAMNLKKTSGGHTTDKSKLWKAVARDGDFLKRQYDLYSPDITICCGTTSEFFDTIYKDKSAEWFQTNRGIWYVKNNGSVIVEYAHPKARIKPNFLYYDIVDAVREIRNSGHLRRR